MGRARDAAISAIRVCVFLLVIIVWGFIGFFYWIPVLARSIGVFAAAITVAAFKSVELEGAKEGLDYAITFYADGFRRIVETLYTAEGHGARTHRPETLRRFLLGLLVLIPNTVWSVLFWGALAVTFLHVWPTGLGDPYAELKSRLLGTAVTEDANSTSGSTLLNAIPQ